jgi:hypothetical protein
MPLSLVTPCGAMLCAVHPYPRACQLLRRLALSWSLEIGNLPVGGHEMYHHALSGGVCMAWPLRNRSPWSAIWFLGGSRVPCGVACCLEGSPLDSCPTSSHPRVVGASLALGTRLQSFGCWWSQSCPVCWVVTGGPRYPGYKTLTRMDISFAVIKLSWFTSILGDDHYCVLERVMHYFSGTMDYGIYYSGYCTVLEGYNDKNWISDMAEL